MLKHYWQVLKKHPRPMKFLVSKLLVKTKLSRFLNIQQRDFMIRFHPTSFTANLWLDPEMRLDDDVIIRTLLSSGDVVVDVGANIGTTALAASRAVEEGGLVYAIEAHPRTFKYLVSNITLNKADNIKPINVAVGDEPGVVFFSDTRRDDMNSVVTYNSGIEVVMETLDHLIPDVEKVDLLKIDVEGYEKFVLQGAEQLLKRTANIYFEVYEKHFSEHQYSSKDVINFLEARHFSIFKVRHENGISLSPVPNNFVAGECENLLAAKSVVKLLKKPGVHMQE